MADFSYTLYLVRYPMMSFAFGAFRLPYRSQPNVTTYCAHLALCGLFILYSLGIWFLFERRTDQSRLWLRSVVRTQREATCLG